MSIISDTNSIEIRHDNTGLSCLIFEKMIPQRINGTLSRVRVEKLVRYRGRMGNKGSSSDQYQCSMPGFIRAWAAMFVFENAEALT